MSRRKMSTTLDLDEGGQRVTDTDSSSTSSRFMPAISADDGRNLTQIGTGRSSYIEEAVARSSIPSSPTSRRASSFSKKMAQASDSKSNTDTAPGEEKQSDFVPPLPQCQDEALISSMPVPPSAPDVPKAPPPPPLSCPIPSSQPAQPPQPAEQPAPIAPPLHPYFVRAAKASIANEHLKSGSSSDRGGAWPMNQHGSMMHGRLTPDYLRNWALSDADIDRCIEDIAYVVDALKAMRPILFSLGSDYAPFFRLIASAVLRSKDCTESSRTKAVATLLEHGIVDVLESLFQQLFHAYDEDPGILQMKHTELVCQNMLNALEAIRLPIRHLSVELALKIHDLFYSKLCEILHHSVFIEIGESISSLYRFRLLSSLILFIQDFILVPRIRCERISEDDGVALELLLNKYVHIKKNGVDVICNRALCYLADDPSSLEQLPLTYMESFMPTDENIEKFIEDVGYVVKRLTSITPHVHLKYPWRYQPDFSFIAKVAPGSRYKGCSVDSQRRLYEVVFADGVFPKLITDLYLIIIEDYDEQKAETCSDLAATLLNVYKSFGLITNGSDFCRNPMIQQQIFDHFIDFLVEQLKSDNVVNALKNCSTSGSVLVYLSHTMLTLVHNFSYYFEQCVPVMREKGMMSVVRKVREVGGNSDVKTSCLLIIAYLLDEKDDKGSVTITDEELSYLIVELEKSMLSATASDYHPEELIEGLTRIAISDMNKLKLLEKNILPLLVKSLKANKYSPSHQAAAARAIWNLAFTAESRQKIINQKGCLEALNTLRTSEHKEVRAAVGGALWQLEGKEQHVKLMDSTQQHADIAVQQIMMSYNHQAKVEVHKMKQRLVKLGYKVWIDEEQITAGGSTLEAMSTAIEESCLVLIFFSEAYKNSINCRAEAEYVFERRKPFLPVQVQARYVPDGWLGILFGSKYRYTLSKPERYDAEVTGLLGKVEEIIRGKTSVVDAPPVQPILDVPDTARGAVGAARKHGTNEDAVFNPPCASWTKEKVCAWLEDCQLQRYTEGLQDLDGSLLKELVWLSRSDSASFHLIISKAENVTIPDLLRLGREIRKLDV